MNDDDSQGDEFFARGDATRRQVLGEDYVNRSNSGGGQFTSMWRTFATRVAWGQFWSRPGLELKTRSICTVSALVALGDRREMKTHMRGALQVGVTPDELAEVLIQVACYSGMPKAGNAFEVLHEVLAES